MFVLHLTLAVASLVCASALAQEATYTTRLLTPEAALTAARAALDSCRKQGFQIAVVVSDRHGLPQVLLRDRFAGAHTVDMATNKAWTAASFRTDTASLAAETQPGRPMSGIRALPRVIAARAVTPTTPARRPASRPLPTRSSSEPRRAHRARGSGDQRRRFSISVAMPMPEPRHMLITA